MKNSKLWNIKLYDINENQLSNNQIEILKLQNLIFNLYDFNSVFNLGVWINTWSSSYNLTFFSTSVTGVITCFTSDDLAGILNERLLMIKKIVVKFDLKWVQWKKITLKLFIVISLIY